MIELLRDVRGGVFTELRGNKDIDVFRRALQRAYVENLDNKLNPPQQNDAQGGRGGGGGGGRQGGPPQLDPKLSDLQAAVRNELKELDNEIERALPGRNGMNKAHLEDLRHRIEEALKSKPATATVTPVTTDSPALRRNR